MSRALPQGELFVVDDGSHVALLEHPDAIRARIETFLVERGITSIG
jgi:pimeloyl-ACP methyl ester carboxylesterase